MEAKNEAIMNTRTIGYWAATGLAVFAFAAGGVSDLLHAPPVMESLNQLGYPAYVATLLGLWKVLGAIAIVAPRFPRLKEWAYAGMFFDLSGAALSHAMKGDPAARVIVPLFLLAIVMVSWLLRPESRTLGTVLPASAPARQLA
ncbi:Hypothetical protein A7982_08133 [Minicystis rosea]|nr:Hypothetical protein A7982_08133 [Minicystis rosea]